MSAKERMIAYHVARLQDKRAEVRQEAIRELELLEAVEAYEPLMVLLETEEDEGVKAAARKFVISHQVTLLRDDNAETRLAAIQMLDALDAVEAFTALEALHQSEADETVKKAAQKIGYRLYKLIQAGNSGDK
jgi:HEAT repeat protein